MGVCNVWVCVYTFILMCIHVWVCVYIIYMYVHTYIYMYVCVGIRVCMYYVSMCVCVRMRLYIILCVRLRVVAIRTRSWDPNLLHEIQICARCGPETLAIWRPIHGMIWKFLPVRAVKTRRWFGSKIASFHVSVRPYIFLYLLLLVDVSVSVCIIPCDCIIYIIPVWLPVSLWET